MQSLDLIESDCCSSSVNTVNTVFSNGDLEGLMRSALASLMMCSTVQLSLILCSSNRVSNSFRVSDSWIDSQFLASFLDFCVFWTSVLIRLEFDGSSSTSSSGCDVS